MTNQNRREDIDKNRRKFLAVMLIGSGTFLVSKILSPLLSGFLNNSTAKIDSPNPERDREGSQRVSVSYGTNKTGFGGFQIAENKNGLSVYDNSGEEILQIDKEA